MLALEEERECVRLVGVAEAAEQQRFCVRFSLGCESRYSFSVRWKRKEELSGVGCLCLLMCTRGGGKGGAANPTKQS